MASIVGICNRALLEIGSKSITSLSDNSVNARDCDQIYVQLLQAELRAHPWSFARRRSQLAEEATTPAFGFAAQYPLPSNFQRILPTQDDNDWQIEGRKILTDTAGGIDLVYLAEVTDPNEMDPLFRESLAMRMAGALAPKRGVSAAGRREVRENYGRVIAEARKVNAFERVPQTSADDEWETVRL